MAKATAMSVSACTEIQFAEMLVFNVIIIVVIGVVIVVVVDMLLSLLLLLSRCCVQCYYC